VFALASPMLALLMSRAVLFGPLRDGLSILAFCVFTCTTIAGALYLVFDGVLAHLRCVRRRHPARFALYTVTAALVAASIMWPSAGGDAVDRTGAGRAADPPRSPGDRGDVPLSRAHAGVQAHVRADRRRAQPRGRRACAALTARLQALQARTNPHFLFNTLNSIMSLVAGRPAQAESMIGLLAKHIRYALDGSERSFVALGDELDAVRDYLGIEQIRFRAAAAGRTSRSPPISISTCTSRGWCSSRSAENAVLHSVSRRIAGGSVRVAVQRRPGDAIDLSVADDGADAGSSAHVGTRTSLANLRERLLLVYGGCAALITSRAADGGFCARVTLPASRAS